MKSKITYDEANCGCGETKAHCYSLIYNKVKYI